MDQSVDNLEQCNFHSIDENNTVIEETEVSKASDSKNREETEVSKANDLKVSIKTITDDKTTISKVIDEKEDEDKTIDEYFSIRDFLKKELNELSEYKKPKMKPQELMINLKFISKLKQGDKINFKSSGGMSICNQDDWRLLPVWLSNKINGVFRNWYKEESKDTLCFFFENITQTVDTIKKNVKTDLVMCSNLVESLRECIEGLENSKTTYHNDSLYISCIDTLISFELISKLKKLRNEGLEVNLTKFKVK